MTPAGQAMKIGQPPPPESLLVSPSCLPSSAVACGLAALLLALGTPAQAAPEALIGILQGPAVLVRQSTRYTLVEGAALGEGDIVETGKGAFAQLEFGDGVLVGLGEATRLIIRPRLVGLKTAAPPRLYLLDGWAKVRLPTRPEAAMDVLTPLFELDGRNATAVVRQQPNAWAVFAESGALRLQQRDGAKGGLDLNRSDFAARREGSDTPAVSPQLSPDFVQQLPRGFRDALPARAELYAKKTITLQSLGLVSYEDVSAWLRTEPGIRLALSRQWRGRASDKAFRAAAAANLAAHMEWERGLFPERFLPKKPPAPAEGALRPATAPANGNN